MRLRRYDLRRIEFKLDPVNWFIIKCSRPAVLLPEQAAPRSGLRSHLSPEKLLVMAILGDALGCYQEGAFTGEVNRRRRHEEARLWILSEDISYCFSFESICDLLELSSSKIRSILEEWLVDGRSNKPGLTGRAPMRGVNHFHFLTIYEVRGKNREDDADAPWLE